MNGTELFKKQIEDYIKSECEKDETFKANVEAHPDITIEHVCNHIFKEVQAAKQCGWADEEIYKMARDCYNDGIKEEKATEPNKIVSNCHVDLTEQEKAEAKQKALDEFKQAQLVLLEREKEKAKEAEEKAKEKEAAKLQKKLEAEQKARGDQMTLDDFFGGL